MRAWVLPLLLTWTVAWPASAQPAAAPKPPPPRDVIGALLDGPPPRDEDEPDTAGQPRTAQDVEPGPTGATGEPPPNLTYAPAPRPQLDAPVFIDETGKTPDAPPGLRDMAYDSRVRASFAAAEGFQGPLNGGWTLAGADGQGLYALQLVDKPDRLEGVWRDLRRKGALDASGLVDDIQRQGPDLTLRFTARPGAPAAVAVLHPVALQGGADGGWSGELTEGGQSRPITLRRTAP